MKYLVLALLLMFCVPSAPLAGPLPEGAVLLARMDGNGRRSAPGTVVITGKDGKVTGVKQSPGDRDRDRNRDKNRDRDHKRDGSGRGASPGGRAD